MYILCKLSGLIKIIIVFQVFLFVHAKGAGGNKSMTREKVLMDFDWRFAFGHAYDVKKDFNTGTGYFSYITKAGFGDGAAAKDFDDRAWRIIDVPHDWVVELPFDSKASYSHGFKTVGRKYPEKSIGWYRKKFFIPDTDLGKRIMIEFGGVHRNCIVWVNGFYLGRERSGYYNFYYDITDYLNYGDDNVVAVRVDATLEEGWYYEGAGIYRHVWLHKTNPLHVAYNGTFVSSDVMEKLAEVTARVTITNDYRTDQSFNIEQLIIDAKENIVAKKHLSNLFLKAGAEQEYSCALKVNNPNLWSVDSPYLYKLVTRILTKGKMADIYETTFGIRTILFDSHKGFFLNGKHLLLKGTNNHQDHAGVGIAIPDALQEYRIRKLKEMGSNAYRCSHYPPAPELLDACDRLGMLVINENRLLGTTHEHLDLLKRMVIRDRNHPSVIIWSIGNEEWGLERNIVGSRVATTMQDFVKKLDPTRRVTYAHSGWGEHGISTVQDVMGFNYIFNGDIDKQHELYPDQPSIGTEETTSRNTRGIYIDNPAKGHLAATDRKPNGRSMEEGMKFYAARKFLSGLFYWTGFDYRGEPNPFGWPQVVSQCGIVDLCGFPKDMFYYCKAWWSDEPVLHIFPHWNWKIGDTVNVWAYTNCEEVDLYLNGRNLGKIKIPIHSHAEWNVIFEPGELIAQGYKKGEIIITKKLETAGAPTSLKLILDKEFIKADGEDLAIITVQVADDKGRIVRTAGNEIIFTIDGPAKIIGVGNGDPASHEPDRYFENSEQIIITNLKANTGKFSANLVEVVPEFNDSNWQLMLDEQENYSVKLKDTSEMMIIRGEFVLPTINPHLTFSIWPKSLGEVQDVFINGKCIAKNIKRGDNVQQYILDNSILRNGKNIFAVYGKPLTPRFLYDNLNTDPGIVQIVSPAGAWKRRAFNGLAQVIIQSKKETGEIVLNAFSEGLLSDKIVIQAKHALIRPRI